MAKDANQIFVRLPDDLIKRLDALAERLGQEPEIAAAASSLGVTRSAALRMALREGLPILESRYKAKRRSRA